MIPVSQKIHVKSSERGQFKLSHDTNSQLIFCTMQRVFPDHITYLYHIHHVHYMQIYIGLSLNLNLMYLISQILQKVKVINYRNLYWCSVCTRWNSVEIHIFHKKVLSFLGHIPAPPLVLTDIHFLYSGRFYHNMISVLLYPQKHATSSFHACDRLSLDLGCFCYITYTPWNTHPCNVLHRGADFRVTHQGDSMWFLHTPCGKLKSHFMIHSSSPFCSKKLRFLYR